MKIARRGPSRLGRAAAALLLAGLAAGGPARGDRSTPARILMPRVGQPLPAVALRTIAGEPLTFEKLRGKAVWIAFFHSS
jgi:hypothetical protein